jgi:glycosyltransferase involved in cell wall biosynthesis
MGYKIAIIGSRGYPYVYSGYEIFVKELAERLVNRGYEVTIYNHRNLFPSRPKMIKGIRLIYIPTIERKTLSQFIYSFQSMIHACFQSYDLIFVVNSANGPLGLLPKIFGKKAVINVDGLEWHRPKWKGLGAVYFYWASKSATKLYDWVVTDSLEMQKIYKNEFRCPSTVIAYGADIRHSESPELIQKWDLLRGGYYLVVGRLVPDNNTDTIIREFCQSRSIKKLVIVGDVPYRDLYAQRLKSISDSRLLFTGYVRDADELAELYLGCFAYLHGHEFGGTNPSLLMALGCGCAVCALDTPFNQEVLKAGEYGFFFTKDANNLKNRIEGMEHHPEGLDRLRTKSRSRIAENYTWNKILGQYLVLFDKVIKERSVPGARWPL